MPHQFSQVTSSFSRSLVFALCLALVLTTAPLPAHTQTPQPASPATSVGLRTTDAPSPNLPDLDTVRGRKEPELKKPEPIPATRCRHWDKKCKTLKNEKVSGLFDQNNRRSHGLIAAANGKSFGNAFDWRASNSAFGSSAKMWNGLQPVPAEAEGKQAQTSPTGHRRSPVIQKNLPLAFASSLLPAMAAMAFQTYSNAETARVEPQNRTGSAGEDLLSGNFNFNIPIVSLPGRAGHDLNLTLTYNSKVWIKSSNYSIRFDMDYGWPSPGFRLGFPTFYGPYVNSTTNRQSFGVILPSGRAVELRQVSGLTETYDAEDGSYLRFKHDLVTGNYILTTPDGTQYIYGTTLDIKDRNGNLITATYNADGLMDTITDTLGRQIFFQYGSFFELLKIQQVWNGVAKDLATFDYDSTYQLMYRFTSGLVPDNVTFGQTLPMMYQVTLLDNSRYKFLYNTYGQVNRYEKYGGLTFLRAWTQYNLPTYSDNSTQSGCPGFTTRTDWAYDWSAPSGVVTSFQFNQSVANPDAASEAANPNLICGQVTTNDGTTYKELYYGLPATSARWRYGLLKMTETWTDGNTNKRKMTKAQYEQPCGGGSIGNWLAQCNPRVAESNIYDNTDGNNSTWEKQRRTTVSYAAGNPTDFNLPADVYEYDYPSTTTVLRRTHTDYNQTSTYINKRIIGLPSASMLYDGAGALASKVEYVYDESGYLQAHTTTPIRQDTANYGIGYLAGRANLTTIRRYNVIDNTFVEAKAGYYVTGNVAFTRDALNHQTTIDYADAFCPLSSCPGQSLLNKNSYAYPTKVTDPDGYYSQVYYNFDLGAPGKTINPKGASALREYDGYGRLWRVTNQVNGAYTRYDFDSSRNFVKSYSTIQDGQGEFYAITTFDGHERPRATVSDHPGSAGLYKGVYNGYDTMGRQSQVSNPTEINSSWIPAGDDVASGGNGGWRWTLQSYDWKGRPLVTTNQDGTTRSISYVGCGCAGSNDVTTQDEGQVNLVGPNNTPTLQRRQEKTFNDVLGRPYKTQVLDWDGLIYSTTITTYNVRDQVTSLKQYQGTETTDGSCPTATCQQASTSYDGHGRVLQQKRPVESSASIWAYNSDDTPYTLTDARGVVSTWGYNNRHLVTSISYTVPANTGIAATSNVTFDYDENGNRKWMIEAATTSYAGGRVDYTFNNLNQLQSETRQFNSPVRSYTISYGYNLAGQLASLTSPFGHTVSYNHDKGGRLSDVSDATSGVTTPFSSQIKYRAWDGIKSLNYGNGLTQARSYDAKLQLTNFTISGRNSQYGASDVMKAVYQYHPDGHPRFADDQLDSRFTRGWDYDHAGRLAKSYTGSEAVSWSNYQQPTGTPTGPYNQSYGYNVWQEMTTRNSRFWSKTQNDTPQYLNARRQGWGYDNAGNITSDNDAIYTFDAAGRNTIVDASNGSTVNQAHDGDGQVVKRVSTVEVKQKPSVHINTTNYYLRSTALGGRVLSLLNQNGDMVSEDFGIGGAEQVRRFSTGGLRWMHQKPLTGSRGESLTTTSYAGKEEPDSGGVNVGFSEPVTFPSSYDPDVPSYTGDEGNTGTPVCLMDGIVSNCGIVLGKLALDYATLDPRTSDRWAAARLGIQIQTRAQHRFVQGGDLNPSDPRLADTGTVLGGETIVVNSGSTKDHWEVSLTSNVVGIGFGLGANYGLTVGPPSDTFSGATNYGGWQGPPVKPKNPNNSLSPEEKKKAKDELRAKAEKFCLQNLMAGEELQRDMEARQVKKDILKAGATGGASGGWAGYEAGKVAMIADPELAPATVPVFTFVGLVMGAASGMITTGLYEPTLGQYFRDKDSKTRLEAGKARCKETADRIANSQFPD